MSKQTADLARLWLKFGENCRGYSPLYERITAAVADDDETLELVRAAPPAAHIPLTLLGAVHYLLLEGFEHPLAEVYAGRSDADPAPLFLDVCRARRSDIEALLATRQIQTNDCGRSTLIGPGLTWIASQHAGPLALVDVGASAGLNLLCDRYLLDYGEHGTTGPAGSPVVAHCRVVRGAPPIAERLPALVARVGIDRAPVDLSNPDDVRWLLACVWPDTGRLPRTAASIRLAQQDPPSLVRGAANEVVPQVLADLPTGASAIITTTWAFAYFSMEERQRFVQILQTESRSRRIAWLSAEGAGVVDAFDATDLPDNDLTAANVLGVMLFDGGAVRNHVLGFAHQHGSWIDWRAPPP